MTARPRTWTLAGRIDGWGAGVRTVLADGEPRALAWEECERLAHPVRTGAGDVERTRHVEVAADVSDRRGHLAANSQMVRIDPPEPQCSAAAGHSWSRAWTWHRDVHGSVSQCARCETCGVHRVDSWDRTPGQTARPMRDYRERAPSSRPEDGR